MRITLRLNSDADRDDGENIITLTVGGKDVTAEQAVDVAWAIMRTVEERVEILAGNMIDSEKEDRT